MSHFSWITTPVSSIVLNFTRPGSIYMLETVKDPCISGNVRQAVNDGAWIGWQLKLGIYEWALSSFCVLQESQATRAEQKADKFNYNSSSLRKQASRAQSRKLPENSGRGDLSCPANISWIQK
jgi:hypothetical protein